MAVYYRVFGLVANLALALNLVLIVAILSMLQATLTLPGIAGIVLTIGMAVDANVLIYERIREELRNGNSPRPASTRVSRRLFGTIADANITTLIAGRGAVGLRYRTDQGIRRDALDRHHDVHVYRYYGQPGSRQSGLRPSACRQTVHLTPRAKGTPNGFFQT